MLKVFIKNINFQTSEVDLREHFENFNLGDIKSVKIIKNKEGNSMGYGFI